MNNLWMVLLAAVIFVGTHFLMSHPLRAPMLSRLGPNGFRAVYSIISLITLAWLVFAYHAAPPSPLLWFPNDPLWILVTILMLIASILLVGSFVRNPALPGPAVAVPTQARGVFSITRHPMLWSFAIWGCCHIVIFPVPKNMIVGASIAILALMGAVMQDRKKERLEPASWRQWEAITSFVPFAAIAAGRARLIGFNITVLLGGTLLWLVATWLHIPATGWPAGIWRWIVH